MPAYVLAENVPTPEDHINNTKKCDKNEHGLNCKYMVGTSFNMEITMVGSRNPYIFFYESSRKGEFYASYNYSTKCIEIRKGEKSYTQLDIGRVGIGATVAHISLKTGNAFGAYTECMADKKGITFR